MEVKKRVMSEKYTQTWNIMTMKRKIFKNSKNMYKINSKAMPKISKNMKKPT